RGFFWSLGTTSHNVGGALIPLIIAFCLTYWGWRAGMLVPGVISILCGVLLLERLRDVPQSLGLPPVDEDEPKNPKSDSPAPGSPLSIKQILLQQVLNN